MNTDKLLEYIPTIHGEHGVDSVLHMLCKKQKSIHEVFSNPPGGSWTEFRIIHPITQEEYSWDHIPRDPKSVKPDNILTDTDAKRPDAVFQFNDRDHMNFLTVESKQKRSLYYSNMAPGLRNFFLSKDNFLGMKNRPAWLKANKNSDFDVIEINDPERYWFRDYEISKVNLWPCFAFAPTPEYLSDLKSILFQKFRQELIAILNLNEGLDLALCVGWHGKYHYPFVIREYSENFGKTTFSKELDKLFAPILFEETI